MKIYIYFLLLITSIIGYSQTGIKKVKIINPPALSAVTATVTNATGIGESDGTITLNTISGGTPSSPGVYNTSWTNIANPLQTVDINALAAGTYKVTVSDANGCSVSENFTVYEPQEITVSINTPDLISCFGNNGSLTAVANGGYPYGGPQNYNFVWYKCDDMSGTNPTPLTGTGSQLNNIKAGFYMVNVDDKKNATIASKIVELKQNPLLQASEDVVNISCFGNHTGSIKLTPTGGSGTQSIVWEDDNTITSFERTGLKAGNYRYTLSDQAGCSSVKKTVTVKEPDAELKVVSAIQQPTSANNDGQIILTATGGIISGESNSYTYQWSKVGDPSFVAGNVSQKLDLGNGTYNINVISSSGCPFPTISITLEALNIKSDAQENVKCYGASTGSITVEVSGGTNTLNGYTYKWFKDGAEITGQLTNSLTAITAGNYRVEVSDDFITIDKTYIVSQPLQPLSVTINTIENVSCNGGSDGKITIDVSGGTTGYTYLWSNTSTTKDQIGLTAGFYSVTVNDSNGCPASILNIEIKQPDPIIIADATITKVAIYGQNTGVIAVPAITGGNGGYVYKWTYNLDAAFNQTTKDISGLKAGFYTLEVTDAKINAIDNAGCFATRTFEVTQNPELLVSLSESKKIKCNGDSNGELTANVTGGVLNYSYKWYKNNVEIGGNSNVLSDLGFGKYKVIVTDNVNAVRESLEFDLVQPTPLTVSVVNQTNVLCYSAATGAINIDVSGGTPPYTYQWTKNGTNYATSEDLTDLTSGSYNVVVKDALGHDCTISLAQPVIISQPAAPLQIASSNIINLKGFETGDGSISVSVSGGKPNYTYEWRKDAVPTIIGTTPVINNLAAGIYHLIVKDDNDCTTAQTDYEVTQPAKLEVVNLTQTPNTNIECNGDLSAEYTIVITGGVKNYTFEWLNTTTGLKYTSVENISATSTASKASNLGAGDYVVSVKDQNNNILFGTNTFSVLQPDKLTFTYTTQNVNCFGGNNGTITLNITGGTKNADVNKPYNIISSGIIDSQNGVVSGLSKGKYTITITDANACQTSEEIEITEPVNSVYVANQVVTPTTGFGLSTGKIEITAAGGTAGYTYVWKNSLGNVVGTNSPTLNNVPADTYTISITDSKGCNIGGTYTIEQPTKPVLTETHVQAKCNGLAGSLNAIATGGATYNQNQSDRSYTYKLTNKTNGLVTSITANTANFINIADGDYTLTATDIGGVDSNTIDVTFLQPTPIVVSLTSKSNVTCYGGQDGSIVISVVGGTPFIVNSDPVYNYQWKKKNTTTNLYENFTPVSLNTLKEGTYAVEVRDANYNAGDATHCVAMLSDIIITQPDDFGFDIDKITYKNPTANGNDGALHFEIIGGKANYEYKLYTKNAFGNETVLKTISNTPAKMVDFDNLNKDHYYISVQDDTGCTKYTDFDFTDNPLTITINQTQNITCFEANNGILKATVNGGFGLKKISWYHNNVLLVNENNAELLNVKIGTYYAVIKDSKLVEVTTPTLTITQPNLVTFSTTQEPVKCLGDSNGTITISASGGNGIFRYRYFNNGVLIKDWTNFANATSTIINGLADGEYNVQVQDTQQCSSADAVVKITSPTALAITNIISVPATGKGLSNGSISITAQGANGGYTYNWFKSDNTTINQPVNNAINLAAGKYYIVVTDAKGCSLTSSLIEVTEPPLLETSIAVQNVVLCNGDKNGSLQPTTTGGFLKPGETYTYEWFENGNPTAIATTSILNGIGKGSYYVKAKDSNGNLATSQILIVTEPQILNNVLTSDYVRCGDFNDWTINANPSGGTLPYSYSWNTGAKTASIQNVTPGNYSVVITDGHGCKVTKNITLVAPAHLDAAENIKIPTCYEGSDATIVVTPIAGIAPYTYLWNTGEKSNTLSNAAAGDYTVDITDSKGCIITRTYTIVNPPKDVINLGEDVTLCFDQTLTINATIDDDKATYSWTSDKGFTSKNAMITISEPANYTVVVTNKLGCQATDTIKISSQNTAIDAEFAMSSQVFKNEKIIVVDISSPANDEIEWILPANATIYSKDKDYAELSFDAIGEYEITMNTKKGNCTATQTKQILVTEGEYENPDSEINPNEKKFDLKIYPNPSKGIFTVDVTLDKVMKANIKVYNLSNNKLIDSKTEDGRDNYLFDFNLGSLPSGIYFVLFESQQGNKLRKIIIQ